MTAKEKIISSIIEEANATAEKVLKEAQAQAQAFIDEQKALGDKQCEKEISAAQQKAETILKAGESSAQLLKRDKLLSCKRELIDEVLASACESILNMKDEEYFEFLYKIAEKSALGKKGELFLSKYDLSRKHDDFPKKIEALSLSLSKDSADINGGFILKYGDIEINCEMKALIAEKQELLVDIINRELFR